MRKRKLSLPHAVLAATLAVQVWLPGTAAFAAPSLGGLGTQASPYIITSRADLEQVNGDMGAWYKLANDIDLSVGGDWDPIGDSSTPFTGNFSGAGYKITGLTIHTAGTGESGFGLFSYVGDGGIIDQVDLENVDVNVPDGEKVGSLVGMNHGTVRNSNASGTVNGKTGVGGLIGVVDSGTVEKSSSSTSVTANDVAGGLAGSVEGSAESSITDSHASGTVSATAINVGGLIGKVDHSGLATEITTSYATGNVSGGDNAGGLIGYNSTGAAFKSYATGNVSGDTFVGGLIGFNDGDTDNTFAAGEVQGFSFTGGLIGMNGGSVNTSYASGNVINLPVGDSEEPTVGGLIGDDGGAVDDSSYFDNSIGYNQLGTGVDPGDLKKKETFNPDTWDFDNVWILKKDSYPTLRFNHVNSAPVLTNITLAGTENTAIPFSAATFTGHFDDVDNDQMTTVKITSLPAKGKLKLNGTDVAANQIINSQDLGTLTYTPAPNDASDVSFTWNASDGTVYAAADATATLQFTAVNDAPVATGLRVSTKQNKAVSGVLAATDQDLDALTYTIVDTPAKGNVVLDNPNTGAFTYTPNPGITGSDTFTFKANDGTVDSNVATVTVDITKTSTPSPVYYPVESISLNESSLAFVTGDKPKRLEAQILPTYATFQQVSWTSSEPAVATVDENGLVTPLAPGETTITVTAQDGGKNAVSHVTVKEEAVKKELDRLAVSERNLWMQPNETRYFRVFAIYKDGSKEDITENDATVYKRSSKSKLTVSKGAVTSEDYIGASVITVTYEKLRLRIPVTISEVEVKKLSFETEEIKLKAEESVQLKVTAEMSNGKTKDVNEEATWSTEDTDVVTLDEDGKVTAIAAGTATIRVIYGGEEAELTVEVIDANEVKRLTVSKRKLTLAAGEEAEVTLTATYADGSKRDVTDKAEWASRNEKVVTVKNGVIAAVAPGDTSLKITYQNKTVTVRITVTE